MGRGQELLDAAREGDRRTVEKIIGQIVTKRSGPFPSLRRGPGVNVQDDNGYTPLHHACLNGHKEIVKLLLSTTCDVPASPCIVDKKGATPLHLAAFKGQTEVVKMLLDYDNPRVNIDQMTTNRETALLIAAHFGYVDIVALLIARGADVTIRNAKMESALDLAAQFGWLDTVKHLVRVRPQLVDPYRLPPIGDSLYLSGGVTTPLHRAAKHGKEEVVGALIDAGFDPNIRTDNGTALHEAACFARADVVRLLLRRGTNLKARDSRGRTVHDMLKEHSKEATRKVREAIKEFDRCHKSSYESEEDLPPFPVVHDYSPTAPVSIIKASASISLGIKKQAYLDSIKMNEEKVTNAHNSLPSPKKISVPKNSSKDCNSNSNQSINSDIPRTDSFITKKRDVQKLIKGRGAEIVASKQFVNHCQVLTELQTLHSNIVKPIDKNSQYSKEQTKHKKIERSNVFKIMSTMWPQLDNEVYPRPSRQDSKDNKKKPIPLPKPKLNLENDYDNVYEIKSNRLQLTPSQEPVYSQNTFGSDELIYANTNALEEQIYQNPFRIPIESEQIYENMLNLNISDDVKANTPAVETENDYTCMMSQINSVKTYKHDFMSTKKLDGSMCDNIATTNDQIYDNYTHMMPTVQMNNDIYMPMAVKDIPDSDIYTHIMTKVESNNEIYPITNIVNHDTNDSATQDEDPENIYLPIRRDEIYLPTNGKLYRRMSCADFRYMARKRASSEYIDMTSDVKFRCQESKYHNNRVKSIPDSLHFGLHSMHIRGVSGCLFEDYDDRYIYELNPNAISKNIYPFTKKKQDILKMPCYCKDLSKCNVENSQILYFSCEKVCPDKDDSGYTLVEDRLNPSKSYKVRGAVGNNMVLKRLDNAESSPDETSTNQLDLNDRRVTYLMKKKFNHIKQLVIDWMAPETQKKSNINDSFIPPSSSLTKSHPQSFVKKLASKCLGLKAKFNSAPNISNNAGTDSEVDLASKSTNQKSNTNTLLIGNSKFFKILSKKEESGEIVCNDEFDTISLDRLGTLNRDSVVNRSNRSCPGFKTSLPNISENNELSDHESIAESVIITEIGCDTSNNKLDNLNEAINYSTNLNIFEPRERTSIISSASADSTHLINECYESYEFDKTEDILKINSFPRPIPRPTVTSRREDDSMIYENVMNLRSKPTPAARSHIPVKLPLDEVEKKVLYENIAILKKPEPPKRTILPSQTSGSDRDSSRSRSVSRSSTSSDSMADETNLEDILLSQKSKSFRHGQVPIYNSDSYKSEVHRTHSTVSDSSDATEASAMENVDCSAESMDDKALYLSMTGTLPSKKSNTEPKKVLFRHKTFTNIEVDRNSVKVKDLPRWNNEFLKETLAHYHIRGTGHCIYNAPTVKEFIYIFNRDTLYKDVPPFTKVANDNRDSYFETAICFCRPRPPKHHSSAEDLLERSPQQVEEKVNIDLEALKRRREIFATSFKCFCDAGTCTFHSTHRETLNDFVVKFSAIKKSISTPDITLDSSFSTVPRPNLPKNYSVPNNLEEPYAVVSVEDIINRTSKPIRQNDDGETYTIMSHSSTLSSSASRMYSIKDIAEVISLNKSSSTASTLSNASDIHLPVRKSSSSEYSGHWSLQSCNSNITIKSDASFKTCLEESSDEDSDGTLHSDDESDTETIKSDISTARRPWVHSDSFRFGSNTNTKPDIETIVEESHSSFEEKFESMSSKFESGISVEGSESSSSGGEDDSGVPRGGDVSLGASLERGSVSGGVRSGSGRRRWDDFEGTSEGDALSISSAASSCAPLHLAHHHDYSKVSPTPPKKPPRRNLSVSPTHANSPSSGYSYELRVHARSQDDLDDIQGAKHYLKHGRSVDHYVDGKLSYSEYEENHNSPRVAPIPNPRPSLKQRSQPVAITAMYENVVIKEQNPRRKLRRNNFTDSYENPKMTARKFSHQERSSLESLLDDQSMNSPSDCERYYDGPRADVPLSPTHYHQPPTPDHPPPSARQAENSIHERIRPLSQEYKRRSQLRDSYTETEVNLLRAASAASVASGATDRSGNTDNCVEEYVCDVPFAGLFKGSTTTLDGIGLRPMPAERPKTLRKLKSVYDSSPTEPPHSVSNGVERNVNGVEEEVRRRSNTTSSTQSGDKSLSILSPFDEQEEWAKISEIMASFGSKLVRESVFVSELEQEFTSRLGLSCSESSLSPSVASNLGLWLSGIGLHDYETLFLESGYDDIDFVNGILDENDLREMGIEENDRHKIIESSKQLPLKITEISNNHNNNNISNKNQNESVDEWLRHINLEQYSDTFRKHLYVDMDRVKRIWEVELTAVLEIQKAGHRKRILASVSGEHNGPANHMEDINADLNNLKNNIQQLKEEIKEKLPPSENLKPVPPPVVPTLMPPGGETLKRSKKNRPAPQPPRPSDLEIRAPSELLVGVPGALKTQWKHQPFVLVTGAVTYVANYLGSTVVKELRGTESTKKSIQKLKKTTKEPRDSPDIILSISYRGVKFLNTITRELICEHEIRNIHCACQDADDLTHFAYITKDHATRSHYCHVFRVATMDQATEVILTLGEAFEVAYQMALREQSNRTKVTQSLAKTPTHDPMTTSNKEKPNINHGRSHSITEIKLNGHQLKIAPLPASLSNEDFQAIRNTDGSRSPRTPLLKAPIASTEEL